MARYYYDRYNIVTTNDFYYPEWPEYDRSWGLMIQYVDYYDTPPLGGVE